jgi:ethanolamine ammonia-lyase small subunit
LVSHIHARGVDPEEAARRILNLAAQMMRVGSSGCNGLPALDLGSDC